MVKILNEKRLMARISRIDPAVGRAVKGAVGRAAEAHADTARLRAPEDTGDLKRSIGWAFGSARGGVIPLGGKRLNKSDITAVAYAGDKRAYYARFQEFGTSRNRAQPYFFPAARVIAPGFRADLKRAGKSAIKAAIRGGS